MCCGEFLLGLTAVPHTLQSQPRIAQKTPDTMGEHPIVWRSVFHAYMSTYLISWYNPTINVTNSDLQLAGSMLHHE